MAVTFKRHGVAQTRKRNWFYSVSMHGQGEERRYWDMQTERWRANPVDCTPLYSLNQADAVIVDLEGHIAYELSVMRCVVDAEEVRVYEA